VFKGKSTYILIIGGLDRQWPAMCHAMNRLDLIDNPSFDSLASRAQHVTEVIRIVQDWVDSHTDEEVEQALVEHRVPFAPALTVEQAMNHPHLSNAARFGRLATGFSETSIFQVFHCAFPNIAN